MDNVKKHNNCINIPSSQTFRPYFKKLLLLLLQDELRFPLLIFLPEIYTIIILSLILTSCHVHILFLYLSKGEIPLSVTSCHVHILFFYLSKGEIPL
jgi:hypothetical protein